MEETKKPQLTNSIINLNALSNGFNTMAFGVTGLYMTMFMTDYLGISPVAMGNALGAQMDVLSGEYNPTGKMSLTMVSSPEVIAITEKEIDGVMREVCASPNDVPGYDKDPYIDPAILAKVKGGSYAYCDADGNYYRSGFGLTY